MNFLDIDFPELREEPYHNGVSEVIEIKGNLCTLAIPFKTLGDFYKSLPIGRQSGIYIIKLNRPNKLPAYYVGKSVDIRYRIQTHFRAPIRDSKKLHNAIRKYPADNFEIGVLEFVSPNDLNTREIYWITKLDLCNSYDLNLTHGGDGASRYKITPQIHDEIADLLLTSDLPLSKIADRYGVTSKVISQINQGMHWCSSPEKYEYNPAIRSIERSLQIKQKAYQDSLNNKVILWQKTATSDRSKLLGTFNSLMKAAKYIEQCIKSDNSLQQQLIQKNANLDNPKLLDNIQTALGKGLREVGKDGLPRGWYLFYVTQVD
jgi:group I intron endonuclease